MISFHFRHFNSKVCLFYCYFFIVFLFSSTISAQIETEKKLIMASIQEKSSLSDKWVAKFYSHIFELAGIKVKYLYLPPKRATMMAKQGLIDGEMGRTSSYDQVVPNLMRIEESVGTFELTAFVTNPEIKLLNWNSLKNSNYVIEYIRGYKSCEIELADMNKTNKISMANNTLIGLKKLEKGRTDVFIADNFTAGSLLKTPKFINSKIQVAVVLERHRFYIFLNKKHKPIAKKISNAIQELKAKNLLDKLAD